MTNRILVIRFSSVGDIVLTEPIVRALKATYRDTEISYLTKARFLPLLEMFANLDHEYGWVEDHDSAGLIDTLRQQRFDLVVDLHASIRSARIRSALVVKAVRAKKEWFKRIASVKLNAVAGTPSHALERYFAALEELGIDGKPERPSLQVPEGAKSWWDNKRAGLALVGNYYVIAAGAAHVTKRTPESLWVALDRSIRNRFGIAPILIGSPAEHDYLTRLSERFDEPPTDIVTEDNIGSAAAAIGSANFVISNDSGLAHLASAVDVPVVALFGPTHPILGFAPLGDHSDFYTVDEYCSPCSLHGDRRCHRSERFCFTKMQVDTIIAKLKTLTNC
jgi:heptosyltransferase II